MNITLRIKRYHPESDDTPRFEDFDVAVEPTDRLLDALMFVKRTLDGTLSFRKSCAHGVCGSDAMTINGVERLACKTLVRDVADEEDAVVTIEPGIYIPEERLGIRIEDDILITADGNENLTSMIPKSVEAIEAVMQR